jgi:hypothetical protein
MRQLLSVLGGRGMFDESDIQQKLKSYLSGQQSFEDFEDWLVENSRARYLDNPPAIREVISQIRYLMFQVIEGEIDERQFKDEARKLVKEPGVISIPDVCLSEQPVFTLSFSSTARDHHLQAYV